MSQGIARRDALVKGGTVHSVSDGSSDFAEEPCTSTSPQSSCALRDELRAYFDSIPRTHGRTAWNEPRAPDYRAVCKRLGDDGWLGVGWPVEYGGQGRGPVEQLIFFTEAERARIPMPVIALNTVGPTLMRFGSDEQKAFFLPKILAGDIDFAIGYSEPEAGTDLASLRTRAVREGDEYVINGNKIFTSGAEDCEYVWLAARTDPDVPKHRGITIFILETSTPRASRSRRSRRSSGLQTTATYYEDVRVPASSIVGGVERRLEAHHEPAQPRARRARDDRDGCG